jgi:hypothetical protein
MTSPAASEPEICGNGTGMARSFLAWVPLHPLLSKFAHNRHPVHTLHKRLLSFFGLLFFICIVTASVLTSLRCLPVVLPASKCR